MSPKKSKTKEGKGLKTLITGADEPTESHLSFIALYLLLILGLIIFISAYTYYTIDPTKDEFLSLVIYTSCAGGLGGTIFCMRGCAKHIIEADFKVKYTVWYIFRPFISTVMGVFAFLLIYGGLISFAGGVSPDVLKGIPINVKAFYCAVAFLAGFSVDEFSTKLGDLCKTLFTRLEKEWKE